MLLPKDEMTSILKIEQFFKTIKLSIFSFCFSEYHSIVHVYILQNNMPNEYCHYVLELGNTLHIIDTEKELTKSVKWDLYISEIKLLEF